jgi:hypothetical protein
VQMLFKHLARARSTTSDERCVTVLGRFAVEHSVSLTMKRSPEYHRFVFAYEREARLLAEEDAAKALRKKLRRKTRPSK